MWKKVKNWLWKRKMLKEINKLQEKLAVPQNQLQVYPITQPTPIVWKDTSPNANLMTFTDGNGDDIFAIDANGNAKWLKEETYNEAAEVFLAAMNWTIESTAGIKQSRMEWEESITAALVKAAEERGGSITAEELTDVVRKCIMYDKLRGKYGES